jgi:dTDP-4-amino-4,6-dideoxygalactose transaminase
MPDDFIPFSPPLIGRAEIDEVTDTLESGWLTTGPKTERFENFLGDYVGAKYAVAVNSCTAALHLALVVLDIGPDDAVICPTYTFASSGHVICHTGATPVFVDSEDKTFNLDVEKLQKILQRDCQETRSGLVHRESGKRLRAIMCVHYGGQPCDMDEIMGLADKYDLKVVEDAAHALGTEYKGRRIGTIGDLTCFSFYATKNLTTGEGGMLVTDNEEWAEKARVLSMYGISDARRIWKRYAPKGSWVYDIKYLGFKYNMMDVQAALGLHQLARLDEFIEARARHAAIYMDAFADLHQIRCPHVAEDARHCWHLFPILVDNDQMKVHRDEIIEILKEKNIGTSVLFQPLHLHSYYQENWGTREGDFPVAEDVFSRVINLPVSPALTEDGANRVARAIWEVVVEHRK